MPDDISDDIQSLSFGSSDRSQSGTVSASSSSSSSSTTTSHPGTISRPGSDLSINDLRFIQRLGSGDIGSVYLAELKNAAAAAAEKRIVAAKVMDKQELEGRNKQGRAKTERAILEVLDHPFLPRLYGTVEDERWSCLITEFCNGGDLHVLRQRQPGRRFDEAAVRFYATEVVVAMEYMHMMGIIYRDLKPENVLVRSDGHIMITDFDLSLKCDAATPAQVVSDHHPLISAATSPSPFSASCILPSCIVPTGSCFRSKASHRSRKKSSRHCPSLEFIAEPIDQRSMSFVGTHEYLAPEIVSGEGHGSAVDWWTLGIFMYELMYGVTPFKGMDNELTLANIVARALEFPKEPVVSASARELVAGLLTKDPEKRLGSTLGATAVKRHPFFAGVNWALLRCAAPPYVPPPFSGSSCNSRELSDGSEPGTPVEYY